MSLVTLPTVAAVVDNGLFVNGGVDGWIDSDEGVPGGSTATNIDMDARRRVLLVFTRLTCLCAVYSVLLEEPENLDV